MQNTELRRRARPVLDALRTLALQGRTPVLGLRKKSCPYHSWDTVQEDPATAPGWTPFAPGDAIGGVEAHYCFRGGITAPAGSAGRHLVCLVSTGATDIWNNNNPQFLAYLNGALVCGLDVNHTEFDLPPAAAEGQTWQLGLYTYCNTPAQDVFLKVETAVRDDEITGLYYDLKAPYEVLVQLDEGDTNAIGIGSVHPAHRHPLHDPAKIHCRRCLRRRRQGVRFPLSCRSCPPVCRGAFFERCRKGAVRPPGRGRARPARSPAVTAYLPLHKEVSPMKYGCRAHDYGCFTAKGLADVLTANGYNAAQLAMPKAIRGIPNFTDITPAQLTDIRTAFAEAGIEISVLSCYQDLSNPDTAIRENAVAAVCRALHYQKAVGAKHVGSESACRDLTEDEKAATLPLLTDSILRIVEQAAKIDACFALEPVFVHTLGTVEKLRTLKEAVADHDHFHIIFDPVNVLTAADVPRQAAFWPAWCEVIGKDLACVHVKDAVFHPDAPRTPTALGAGQMDYTVIREWLHRDHPDAALLRDEVILPAAQADLAYIKAL